MIPFCVVSGEPDFAIKGVVSSESLSESYATGYLKKKNRRQKIAPIHNLID
jgi:hypothetical protein